MSRKKGQSGSIDIGPYEEAERDAVVGLDGGEDDSVG